MKIILATNNAHKLKEVQAVLGDGFHAQTPGSECGVTEEIPEEQETLEGNASQKAHYLHDRAGCDRLRHGPRSRRSVAPGVHLARATDKARLRRGTTACCLAPSGVANRRARFRTVISLILGGEERLFEGIVEGRIIDRTGHEGFGFDPLFVPDGYDRTFAEMTTEEKNAVSHRARAVRKLADYLHSIGK